MEAGLAKAEATREVFDAYLDGKPHEVGRRKLTHADRNSLFWSSSVVDGCQTEDWESERGTLVMARYLSQTKFLVDGLIQRLAAMAPAALVVAMRRSFHGLALGSPHVAALRGARACSPKLEEACRVQDILAAEHWDRLDELDRRRAKLQDLTVLDLLALASLYAFEQLVPHTMLGKPLAEVAGGLVDAHWDSINDLLIWKLKTVPSESLSIDEQAIVRSLKRCLSPMLFPVPGLQPELAQLRLDFAGLLAAQLELNAFQSHSIEAYCYDDSIRFVPLEGRRLKIEVIDPAGKAKWERDGMKLATLPGYWMTRAFQDFASSDLAHQRFGRPENEDENRLAYIRAMATQLRLREVYGVGEKVSARPGETADLFQALLSLELTARYFMLYLIIPFTECVERSGDWVAALQSLAMEGLCGVLQNRFPLTWSSRADKVRNTIGWTVTPECPMGSARMAETILDFWAYDMQTVANRLRREEPGLEPSLVERPYLKFGTTLVQLPWVVAMQNNGTAAINNLRRLASRRSEAGDETRRIEGNLARHLADRGFCVELNWTPPAEQRDAGEVDVVASLDGHLFVFEVKSTYLRQSMRDAWVHASTTLRKAGLQLKRKVQAVRLALESDAELRQALGVEAVPSMELTQAWIVDTSIECDHERFSGFLKVSFEEVMLALRDDSHLLDDPEGLMSGQDPEASDRPRSSANTTLYPLGFKAERFVEVIERELVWADT